MPLQKCISGNDYNNGAAVVKADKFGDIDKVDRPGDEDIAGQILAQSGVLDTRLDDNTYYTA